MKNKKLLLIGLSITLSTVSPFINAKKIFPSDILGRELIIPGVKWAGHVGIATRSMYDPSGMSKVADLVIEVLREPVIGQINTINDFKRRSKYWGSKYGVVPSPNHGYKALVEANHQRWWVSEYTVNTDYRIGEGNPNTGAIFVTGRWRCDTYAWWAYFSQGIDTMPSRIWLPRTLFNFFPYFNDERFNTQLSIQSSEILENQSLDNVTSEDLNEMSFEKFQTIMNTPIKSSNNYISTNSAYMRFAFDENLNEVKRGAMIDKITSKGNEINLVSNLIKLYNETNNEEVKNKVVSGLMYHVQGELRQHPNINDKELLRNFFHGLISEKLNQLRANWATMGFIDTHTPEEILNNVDKIDNQLVVTTHQASIIIKYKLVFISKELQSIYIQSIVDELKKANDSDLDGYFFGPLIIGYKATGKNLLNPESKKIILTYLDDMKFKYSKEGIKSNPNDFHRQMTAPIYFELLKLISN